MTEKNYFALFNFLSNFYRIIPAWLTRLNAHILAIFIFLFAKDRNLVLQENLNLCSKQINIDIPVIINNWRTRYQITRYHTQTLIDYTSSFSMSVEEIKNFVKIKGAELLKPGTILYFPHFTGLPIGSWLTTRIYGCSLLYSPPKQKALANWIATIRNQLIPNRAYAKTDSILPIAKLIKKKQLVQLSTDLDVGDKDTILSHFFTVPIYTSKALPYFIEKFSPKLVGAVCTYIGDDKSRANKNNLYKLEIEPILISKDINVHNYKNKDEYYIAVQDELHKWLESKIRQYPTQYWWFHKRFKTAKNKKLI